MKELTEVTETLRGIKREEKTAAQRAGLNLRDHFAVHAPPSAFGQAINRYSNTSPDPMTAEQLAAVAYEYADAMLAEREKKA